MSIVLDIKTLVCFELVGVGTRLAGDASVGISLNCEYCDVASGVELDRMPPMGSE